MKNELVVNQINWFLKEKQRQIFDIDLAKEKGNISSIDYMCAIKSRQGAINALQIESSNLEAKIVEDINMYQQAKKKLEVNFLNSEDQNLGMFHLLCGAIDVLMLLLTCTSNPLSACPLNKDILLSKSIIDLEEEIKNEKNKEKLVELKNNLKITKELWQTNQTLLKTF